MRKSFFIYFAFWFGALLAHAQSNPVPLLNQPLVPTSTTTGGPGFALTVNGTAFTSASVVEWNSKPLATSFVSDSQLSATVPAAAIAHANTATITVVTPGPGGGTSNELFLPVSQATAPTFTNYSDVSPPLAQTQLVAAPVSIDLNGDGNLDVVSGYGSGIAVQLGNGDGSFQSPIFTSLSGSNLGVSNAATAIAVGDFDGDGKVDVAAGLYSSELVGIFLGNGDGTFASPTKLTLQANYEADFVTMVDINKDGKLDLLSGNNLLPDPGGDTGDASLSVFFGNGDGTFQAAVDYKIGNYMDSMTVGDVNGDGNVDVIVSTSAGFQSGFTLLGNGDGTLGSPTAFLLLPAPQMSLADVNGDGKLDLLGLEDSPGGNLHVYLGNGDGTFAVGVLYSTGGANPISFTMGDFNADGKLDAAMGNNLSQDVAILYGKGDGTFETAITYPAPAGGLGIASGDFNQDGRLDIFLAPSDSNLLGSVLLQGSFPVLSPSPGTLTFAQQAMNTTSLAQSVTLTNSGGATLTISKISLTGTNGADYAESNNCGATLAVNAACQISITFTPTGQGMRSAILSVTDNAPGSPQGIGLTGMTTPAAALTLSPSSVSFPGQFVGTTGLPQSITATNTGGATLTITSVTSGSKDFGVLNACGDSLAAGASCSIGVFFDPTSSGTITGAVTIADSATGSPQTVTLSGTGQDFSVSASSPTATVTPGQTANYMIAVSPIAGFNQTVALSCSGAPTGSACSLSSSSVTLSGTSSTSVTVSVVTVGSSIRHPLAVRASRVDGAVVYLSICGFPGVLLLAGRRRMSKKLDYSASHGLMVLTIFLIAASGCGGGSGGRTGGGGTAPATYSLTVTATSAFGSTVLTHDTVLTLVVQ